MLSRRSFAKLAVQSGIGAATAPLWQSAISERAFAQVGAQYKAVVLITLGGGNDGNNMLIPLDPTVYQQYARLRTALAIDQSSPHVLRSSTGQPTFGLHPSLTNVAAMYNSGTAAIVSNVGPLHAPVTKAELQATPGLAPPALMSHPAGLVQWESATVEPYPSTGWGGRIGDLVAAQSGRLPPGYDAAGHSIFTVGRSVQGVSIVTRNSDVNVVLPAAFEDVMLDIANVDAGNTNRIVAKAAALKASALRQQAVVNQARSAGNQLKTAFPQNDFGLALQAIAQIINGRSVIGATRQIFYAQQGVYDTHQDQMYMHSVHLSELDRGIGAFYGALQEMGLENQVLICTHSDFNRTILANVSNGSDHAWGNHQLILGGGIRGGRIIGTYPDLDLNGGMDFNGYGTWIPTLAVSQMVGGIASWMGLSASQVAEVVPDVSNFSAGSISLL